jgi:hypothetical protein
MADSEYKVKSVLICDDARQEVNGKEILIGVYNDTIVVERLPAMLFKFVIRVALRVNHHRFKKFSLQVIDQAKNKIVDASQDIPAPSPDPNVIIGVQLQNLTFAQSGNHEILFGFDDKLRKIGEFEIRLPASLEEQKLLNRPA